MSDDDLPQADQADGAPHPRETLRLFGHDAIEAEVLAALTGERAHHGWLLTGPRGIGKATLAWRMARFLLTEVPADAGLFGEAPAPTTLDIDPNHPVAHRIAALSEPGCLLIRRAWDHDRKKLKAQITVDEVRKLNSFFGLSATDGGRRVVIVDSADEMNPSAANALLKVLEEPPKGATLILVSHQPARLLPTIRSRCRVLRMNPLSPDALANALDQAGAHPDKADALSALSGGSAGDALRVLAEDGIALYARIIALLDTCPQIDRTAIAAITEKATARGAEARLDLLVRLLDLALTRLARTGAGHPPTPEACAGEAEVMARLSPSPAAAKTWAALQQELGARIGHGRAVNIDPQSLLMDAFLRVAEASRG
ncbi:MAG: DNA polymerase III subunit delta' [Silicimonas sp.]|nr:DNA polymerase III subunit delta' [Silicimonas sp.]